MTTLPDLEKMLTEAAQRRWGPEHNASPRRRWARWLPRRRASTLALAVFLMGGTALAATQPWSPVPDPPRSAPDATPASSPQVSASTRGPDGGTVGVVTYRNEAGRLCMAQGHVRADGVLADKGGREIPYQDLGDCSLTPNPVTVAVGSVSNDPMSPQDDSKVLIYGVASEAVARLKIELGQRVVSLRPGKDGAFIVAGAHVPTDSPVTITAEAKTGQTKTINLPPPPNLQEITKGADEVARGGP